MNLFKRKLSEADKLVIGLLKNGFEKLAETQQKEFFKNKEIERLRMIKEKFEFYKQKEYLTDDEKKDFEFISFLVKYHCL